MHPSLIEIRASHRPQKSLAMRKESDVRNIVLLAVVLFASLAGASPCPTNQSKDPSVLADIEHTWADALDHQNPAPLECILATEFQDINTSGQIRDRAQTLAAAPKRMAGTDRLSDLDPHVQGDIGYIRGVATLVDPSGKTVAQVRFTDLYLYRDGRWQCVAGQETLVSEKK